VLAADLDAAELNVRIGNSPLRILLRSW